LGYDQFRKVMGGMVLLGLILFVVGAVWDVAYHTLPRQMDFLPIAHGSGGYLAHVVTFIGMLVTVLGVVAENFLKRRVAFPRGGALTQPDQTQAQDPN
jgi:predicted transporter